MRKLTLALATAAVLAVPGTAQAQVGFGVLAAFHDDADFGVGAFVDAPMEGIHENVHLMGDFTWFFPDEDNFAGVDVDVTYFQVNGNLLYDFPMADQNFTPFALGGLNIARVSVDSEVAGIEGSASDTEVGLNLGGGLTFGTGSLRPAVGARVELGGGEGFVIFGSLLLGGG